MEKRTTMKTLATANWDALERDVVTRIRFLKAAATKLESGEVSDKIAEDVFLPCLELLAEFCGCIDVRTPRMDS